MDEYVWSPGFVDGAKSSNNDALMGAYYGTKTYHDQWPDQKTINRRINRERS